MLLAPALPVFSCDIRGTGTSPQGVLQNCLTMRYRVDEAHIDQVGHATCKAL